MMHLPPSISRAATLELILALRAAATPEEVERLERKIMEGNLRFCAYHARRYRQPDIELDDLIAVAAAALLDAVRRFDPEKSRHFAAYARRCIRRDLATMIRRQVSPVRLPREPRRGEAARGRIAAAIPRAVSMDGVEAVQRGVTTRIGAIADVEESVLPGQKAPLHSRGSLHARAAVDHALETENPEDGLLTAIDAERIAGHVKSLPDREATIVRMRFGLDGCAAHELAEIGAVLSISKQRVQVILDNALASLRESLGAAA